MCGFVGWVRPAGLCPDDARRLIAATEALDRRGPDGRGLWSDEHLALGSTRLAVRGGKAAAQPLCLHDKDQDLPVGVLAFNGEIYSFNPEAKQRDGELPEFSDSDTRRLAEHLDAHGVERLDELDGMFAFAYWQPRLKRLLLARDRWGEKPLYWAPLPAGGLAFASEPGALLPIRHIDWTLAPDRVTDFVRHSFWPEPGTPWTSVHQLAPGQVLEWINGAVRISRWWTADAQSFATVRARPSNHEVRQHLHEAVRCRLVGDRAMGALLSGGLDSSLLVALAVNADVRLPVWTVRWEERGWDEREYASIVAEHLGLRHTWVDVHAGDLPRRLDELVDAYGEPFGDESLLPTSIVIEAASQDVAVVITGDGGDELFGGYERYSWRGGSTTAEYLDTFCATPNHMLNRLLTPDLVRAFDMHELPGRHVRDQRRWIDLHGYLSNDLLRKVDRAAGRVGVENRAPFLARDVSNFALSLSAEALWKGDVGKQPLRALAGDLLPASIVQRKKRGFGVPLIPWFRGALRPWLSDRLLSGTLAATGWFRQEGIEAALREHAEGADRSRTLFNLLVLAVWLERWPNRLQPKASALSPL